MPPLFAGEPSPLREAHPNRAGQSVGPQDQGRGGFLETARKFVPLRPTYSSWLNQVELWFAKIQRDVIARGVFTSLAGLARKTTEIRSPPTRNGLKKVLGWLIPTPGFESAVTKAPGQLEVATSVGKS